MHCRANARLAGIPIEALRRQVAGDIEAYLASDVDFPADMAEAFWLADTRTDGDLRAFLEWRCTVVTSLVREVPRRGAKGRDGGGDFLGRATDRRRVV